MSYFKTFLQYLCVSGLFGLVGLVYGLLKVSGVGNLVLNILTLLCGVIALASAITIFKSAKALSEKAVFQAVYTLNSVSTGNSVSIVIPTGSLHLESASSESRVTHFFINSPPKRVHAFTELAPNDSGAASATQIVAMQ